MCKKAVKKIFGGGGSPKAPQVIEAPQVIKAPTPAPSAVSVNAPSSNPESSMGLKENETNENTFKRKGKNALKIAKKNPSMQGLQI